MRTLYISAAFRSVKYNHCLNWGLYNDSEVCLPGFPINHLPILVTILKSAQQSFESGCILSPSSYVACIENKDFYNSKKHVPNAPETDTYFCVRDWTR